MRQIETKTIIPSKKNLTIKILVSLTLIVFLLLISGYFFLNKQMEPVCNGDNKTVHLEIPINSGTGAIAQMLYDYDLIKSPILFKLYLKNMGLDKQLKAGSYELSPSMSLPDIIKELIKGQHNLLSFTIPEGLTIFQVAHMLEQKGIANYETFLEAVKNKGFDFPWLKQLPEGELRLEGFLFPDTYKIPEGYPEDKIIQMMLDRFKVVFTPEYETRLKELNMDIMDAITLASIIEREIKVSDEQSLASAVFHNRLSINMKLQSCATVQYVLGEAKENLTNSDLSIPSPYNTYQIFGLPPGPIASPGKGAIIAALYPSDEEYLYFLVKPDGSHYFSKTYAEHLWAKKKYLN